MSREGGAEGPQGRRKTLEQRFLDINSFHTSATIHIIQLRPSHPPSYSLMAVETPEIVFLGDPIVHEAGASAPWSLSSLNYQIVASPWLLSCLSVGASFLFVAAAMAFMFSGANNDKGEAEEIGDAMANGEDSDSDSSIDDDEDFNTVKVVNLVHIPVGGPLPSVESILPTSLPQHSAHLLDTLKALSPQLTDEEALKALHSIPDDLDELLTTSSSNGHPMRWDVMSLPPSKTFSLHAHPNLELVLVVRGRIHEVRRAGSVGLGTLRSAHPVGPDMTDDNVEWSTLTTKRGEWLVNPAGSVHLR